MLRTQIIESIKSEYLDALCNVDTDIINETNPEILDFLQSNYGWITKEQLVKKEDEVKNFDYDPHTPVDKVFNKITLLQDLCIITHNNKTDKQLCQMAYLIFNCTRAFMDSLKKWNKNQCWKDLCQLQETYESRTSCTQTCWSLVHSRLINVSS